MDTAEDYRSFARSARGSSPTYERLATAVAGDREVLGLLDALPEPKRQPNLLFGAVRFLAGPVADAVEFRRWLLDHRSTVVAVMLARRTQTNEVGRCAILLPALAQLPGPLALLEVGTSAGLCLLPDRYGYDYDGHWVGPPGAELVLPCSPRGPVPLPPSLPEVVWRAGIDLHPIDVDDTEEVRWLEALIWPDQPERLERLRTAVRIARREPPRIVEGNLLDELLPLAEEAPVDATLVVFHSAVLTTCRRRTARSSRHQCARWEQCGCPTRPPTCCPNCRPTGCRPTSGRSCSAETARPSWPSPPPTAAGSTGGSERRRLGHRPPATRMTAPLT